MSGQETTAAVEQVIPQTEEAKAPDAIPAPKPLLPQEAKQISATEETATTPAPKPLPKPYTQTAPLFFQLTETKTDQMSERKARFATAELSAEILSFNTDAELAMAGAASKEWLSLCQQVRFQQLKKQLQLDSLAIRLLKAPKLGPELFTQHCQEVFGENLVLTAPDGKAPPDSKAVTIEQYFKDAFVAIQPYMEHPPVIRLFYGGQRVKADGSALENTPTSLSSLYGTNASNHWRWMLGQLEKAQAAESIHFDVGGSLLAPATVNDQHNFAHYQAIINCLSPLLRFESFLADTILVRQVAQAFTANQHLLTGMLPPDACEVMGQFYTENDYQNWLRRQQGFVQALRPLLQNYKQTAGISSRALLIFANLRFVYFFLPELVNDAHFTQQLQSLTPAEINYMSRQGALFVHGERREIANFAGYFHWFAKQNKDLLLKSLPKNLIFWLLKKNPLNLLLLKSPTVVDKLTDAELLDAVSMPSFSDYFNECIENPQLVKRLTPTFCFKAIEKNPCIEDMILTVPPVMIQFNGDELFKLLKSVYSKEYLLLAKHYFACFDKLSLSQLRQLVTKCGYLKERPLEGKAYALMQYLALKKLQKLNKLSATFDTDLVWLENTAVYKELEQTYQTLQQELIAEEEAAKAEQQKRQIQEAAEAKALLANAAMPSRQESQKTEIHTAPQSSVSQRDSSSPPVSHRRYREDQTQLLSKSFRPSSLTEQHPAINDQSFPWFRLLLGLGGLYLLACSIGAWITSQAFLGITLAAAPWVFVCAVLIGLLLAWSLCSTNPKPQPLPVLAGSEIPLRSQQTLGPAMIAGPIPLTQTTPSISPTAIMTRPTPAL